MKRIFVLCLMLGALSTGSITSASPIVITPGEASSYLYFPTGVTAAGESGTTSGLVGMIAAFYQEPSSEWLVCDGSTIQSADYPELVKHLSPGNPSATSAVLPDFRGYFLRGWDSMGGTAAGVDAGRAMRTTQGDENKAHGHTVKLHNNSGSSNTNPAVLQVGAAPIASIGEGATSSAGGLESRPKNISVIYAIRAK